jgi:NAD(P)-dependent dehydrogenase (short-subunit alcohol dehydrogenase family)
MNKRTAVIIGGGSSIGADAARKLNKSGYNVAVMSSSGEEDSLGQPLEQFPRHCLGQSSGAIGFTGSNLVPSDLKAFIAVVMDAFGRIDGVVNCTGHGSKGELLTISDEDGHLGMDYYLTNVIRSTRLIQPIMAKQGGGSIVNISTFAVVEPDPDFQTSAVFRGGLATYTKLFSTKYATKNIRMNNILPGFIDSLPEKTDNIDQVPVQVPDQIPTRASTRIPPRTSTRTPFGQPAEVNELSNVIRFLISEDSNYITGQNLRVDGSLTHSI